MTERLDLQPDELLTTTRAVRRRLDLDRPVDLDVIRECLQVAIQAPSASNTQSWQWMVIADPAQRSAIGGIYKKAFTMYRRSPGFAGAIKTGDPERDATQIRVGESAEWLADRMGQVPVLLIPCFSGRVEGQPNVAAASSWGSLLPAAWTFCLAARARGLGTAWTTLHLMFEREAADVLGIPYEQVTQGALIPVAYTKGTDFKPAPRVPLEGVLHVDSW